MDYTPEQIKAIQAVANNLQIIACAGSGKTQVVSARIVEILKRKRTDGVSPENIVAFTFTDKAAGELRDRVHSLCREEFGEEPGLADMFIGTIHSFCLNLLQSPPLYRYLKYGVLDDIRQRLLIDRYSVQSGLTSVPLLNGKGKLRRWVDSKLYQQLISIMAESTVDKSQVPETVLTAIDNYKKLLNEKRYLDYGTIISQAVAELDENFGNKEIRTILSDRIKYLIVDEYQDVNPLQEKLIKRIQSLGANLCVVGDDDQTIYQWRGSEVKNIIDFTKRYPKVKEVPMELNFRSSEGVVKSAIRIIEEIPDSNRLEKEMKAFGAQQYERGDLLALSFDNPEREAEWIAGKIESLLGTTYRDGPGTEPRGLTYSDFAILFRSVRNDAAPVIDALDDRDIPYVVGGMNDLFNTPEIDAVRQVFYFLGDFSSRGAAPVTKRSLRSTLLRVGFGLSQKKIEDVLSFLAQRKGRIGKMMEAELFLQRLFLDFLERLEIREENVTYPGDDVPNSGRGEIVFYNLGKFSQVISDYEHVHFNTSPQDLYPAFASFLFYQAPGYYPEGWKDAGAARPDAIQIMTVHQAKGMQWPTVFIPCLRRNRFPSRRQGGRQVWHVIPDTCIENPDRYKGMQEDERRLFYVAMTRAEKYLYCSWAPVPNNNQQKKASAFFTETTRCQHVLTSDPTGRTYDKTKARPRKEDISLLLTFSELRYYFDCPYLFKLKYLYGFDEPISRALGYGKSLHDALAEIHTESLNGNLPDIGDVPRLIEDHLHLPYANEKVREYLRENAQDALERYIGKHGKDLTRLEHAEKLIELRLGEGVVVNGRIDLIRRTDTDEVVIVDFKSDERAQTEEITKRQLHIYALGYEQQTGRRADLIEIHNLDEKGANHREMVDQGLIEETTETIVRAGRALRENELQKRAQGNGTCEGCGMKGVCREAAP